MPKVTMIPATINPLTHLPSVAARKRRVAGYARVSTDSDEQFTSYEAQVDYYTKCSRCRTEVPEMPSSAKMPANSHSGFS